MAPASGGGAPPPKVDPLVLTSTLDERDRGEAYTPLWDCKSSPPKVDSPLDRVPPAPNMGLKRPSVVSLPDEPAPPPPDKMGASPAHHDMWGGSSVYDHPNKSYVNLDDNDNEYKVPQHFTEAEKEPFYKVPPTQHKGFVDDTYKVPPPPVGLASTYTGNYDVPPSRANRDRAQRTSRSSDESQSSHFVDSGWESSDTYDKPTWRYNNEAVDQMTEQMRMSTMTAANRGYAQTQRHVPSTAQEVYDFPKRKTVSENNILDSAPDRSYINLPPPTHLMSSSPQRLGHVPPPPMPAQGLDSMYDIPPTHNELTQNLPPPPQPCSVRLHHYKNAPPAQVVVGHKPKQEPVTESVYMPMGMKASQDELYLSMGNRTSQQIYTNMDIPAANNRDSSIYSAPPSSRPVPPPSHAPHPPAGLKEESYQIFFNPTHRTRSFKRPAGRWDGSYFTISPSHKYSCGCCIMQCP